MRVITYYPFLLLLLLQEKFVDIVYFRILDKILKIRFDEAHQEYLAIDPKSVMPIVRETFKQYNQVKSNQMYKIYMDLFDIVNADGKIDESERIALDALKEIIDTHSAAVRK